MVLLGLPLFLEDRTGHNHSTEYDDIYDRMFIGVSSPSSSSAAPAGKDAAASHALNIYNLDRRSSPRGFVSPLATSQLFAGHDPTIVLEFGPGGSLGTVLFMRMGQREPVKMAMAQWVRKTALFGGSSSRKFRASDGEDYIWTHKMSDEAEWSCTNGSDYVVATYSLKPPDEPTYRSSGNALTVYEAYSHLAIELLASLTIMRHIRQCSL